MLYSLTFTSVLFDKDPSVDALTIMLVMMTIFTSKIEELPSTSDTKMTDIWFIRHLLYLSQSLGLGGEKRLGRKVPPQNVGSEEVRRPY